MVIDVKEGLSQLASFKSGPPRGKKRRGVVAEGVVDCKRAQNVVSGHVHRRLREEGLKNLDF